jgi:hypothetical protein
MNTQIALGGAAASERLGAIEALLSRYPQLGDAELAELKRWFAKEATAFDIASLASKDELREQYAQFRAEHVDRFSARDLMIILAGVAIVAAFVAYLW